jgi:drug/metabolite transporter (DMT)-like permease
MGGKIRTVMGVTEWTLLVILGILWGGSYFFGKVALAQLPPFTVAVCRLGLAAVVLHVVVRAAGYGLPGSAPAWRRFWVMGLLNNVIPMSLILWGQTRLGSGLAAILNASTPLFTVLLAHVFTRDERMTANRVGGVLFGLAGVAVMIGSDALGGLSGDLAAQLAVLGAAVSYACAGIFGRRFGGIPPLVTAAGQVTASTLTLLPLTLVVDRPWLLPLPRAKTWAAVIALALLCTALAYVIYFRILATSGASNLLLVTLLMPASAVLLGTTVLGERLEPRQLAGMALLAVGLAAVDGRAAVLLRRLMVRRARPASLAADKMER